MPPSLYVDLTAEENRTLLEIRTATHLPQRVKDRAEAVRLCAIGLDVQEIAQFLDWAPQSVRVAIHRWEDFGLSGLWDAPRSGSPRCYTEADLAYLEQLINGSDRHWTAEQLSQQWAKERNVQMSADQLRRILKKKGIHGSDYGGSHRKQSQNISERKKSS
jgi:transposase